MRHPVVRLSFGRGDFGKPGCLDEDVAEQFEVLEQRAGIEPRSSSAPVRFSRLLRMLHERTGQRAVVPVDEYERARANRNCLRGLYAILKDGDADIRFSFITGVSEFARTTLFSGVNDLGDVTLDARCSAICGYAENDLDETFAPELDGLDRGEIREWYNGYSWLGEARVYNPFGILQLFDGREFGAG